MVLGAGIFLVMQCLHLLGGILGGRGVRFHFLDRLTFVGDFNGLSSSVRCDEFLCNIAIFLQKWG